MTNKKMGNDFEQELCEKLSEYGFWVHNLAQNKSGQPADIIAVRNGKAYLIDAKVCTGHSFPLSRIEENQTLAMAEWERCGNGDGWFAFKSNDIITFLTKFEIGIIANGQKAIPVEFLISYGVSFDKWVRVC